MRKNVANVKKQDPSLWVPGTQLRGIRCAGGGPWKEDIRQKTKDKHLRPDTNWLLSDGRHDRDRRRDRGLHRPCDGRRQWVHRWGSIR